MLQLVMSVVRLTSCSSKTRSPVAIVRYLCATSFLHRQARGGAFLVFEQKRRDANSMSRLSCWLASIVT